MPAHSPFGKALLHGVLGEDRREQGAVIRWHREGRLQRVAPPAEVRRLEGNARELAHQGTPLGGRQRGRLDQRI
ncbi:hypothetical protein D187_009595 [Cystobacter fuscus DSM 2262]|uniref:Uncharacterized protein n=1 Tax=Cystobacter fuscus (strain ATCC 25194 / DSM 2262 / NBRC 100088 / M29) TaxID=1242864 RepID=S9Q1E7_CYSF2|nr:hypothetical protein D187_009595 [Cystobacter fuscus DSM 2262]